MVENIRGYHGTSTVIAKKILKEQSFYCSSGKKHWLGSGIYFFEHCSLAEWWAQIKSKKHKGVYFYNVPISVLEVCILVEKNKYLDLSDPMILLEYFEGFYKPQLIKYSENGSKIKQTKENALILFSIFLEIYKKNHKIEAVKGIFPKDGYEERGEIKFKKNNDIYNHSVGMFGMKLNEIQICVGTNKNISNINIV